MSIIDPLEKYLNMALQPFLSLFGKGYLYLAVAVLIFALFALLIYIGLSVWGVI